MKLMIDWFNYIRTKQGSSTVFKKSLSLEGNKQENETVNQLF